MKRIVTTVALASLSLSAVYAHSSAALWRVQNTAYIPTTGTQVMKPQQYLVYNLGENVLQSILAGAPASAANAITITLPTPDGNMRDFKLWETAAMEPALAAKYPGIKTYTAVAIDNKNVTAKIDFTYKGFHAMVFDGDNTYRIDPYSTARDGYYTCFYRRDFGSSTSPAACELGTEEQELQAGTVLNIGNGLPEMGLKTFGTLQRTYRLALACTGEYAVAVAGAGPTKPNVLSAMVTSINRVNSVYEREFSATFQLIANEDTLIFLDGTTDPYINNNGSTMLGENQTTVTDRIGSANFDMGHVFSTGGGGVATLNSVCNTGTKARGVTGLPSPIGDAFDIDYVAHEMGHQFGGQHTFNANTGSCSGNGVSSAAFEPGSGTTIMAYAGICQVINNLQAHSNPYFHAKSLDQMSTFMNAGGNCATTVASANTNSKVPAFADSFNIPLLTPFELTAPVAEDTTADTITYCWEEWDLGSFRSNFSATRITGPIFRSYNPDTSRTRIFPHIDSLLKYPPVISYLGEKLADTSRILKFKLTVRDLHNGWGCFNIPDDTMVLSVINTPAPFKVMQPDTSLSLVWMTNHMDTVKWDVAGTDTSAVQCANVDIYLSVDGGRHYPYLLAAAVPNNGLAVVTVPDTVTTTARVKVKGTGNVFFDLSDRDFIITADTTTPPPPGSVAATVLSKNVSIYPVPAKDVLHIQSTMNGTLEVAIYNAVGQAVWKGNMQQQKDLQVNNWAKGVYYVQLIDKNSKEKMVKPVVIQ